MKTYNLHQPMDWAALNEMPEDLQKQYFGWLISEYNANNAALAEMLQVNVKTARFKVRALGIRRPTGGACKMTPAEWTRWRVFLGGSYTPEPIVEAAAPEAVDVAADPEAVEETHDPEPVEETAAPKIVCSGGKTVSGMPAPGAVPYEGSMTFRGPAESALRAALRLLGDTPLEVRVLWRPIKEDGRGES